MRSRYALMFNQISPLAKQNSSPPNDPSSATVVRRRVDCNCDSSPVRLPFVLEPAAGKSPAGVVVCPMNDAPFRGPFILPPERHLILLSQAGYSRRDIDVVGDEHGLSRAKLQDETLMPAPIIVVGKYPPDHALAFDLKIAGALFEGATED